MKVQTQLTISPNMVDCLGYINFESTLLLLPLEIWALIWKWALVQDTQYVMHIGCHSAISELDTTLLFPIRISSIT